MTTDVVDTDGRRTEERPARLRWWRELLYVLAFYAVYSFIRNRFGSAAVGPEHAFDNARHIIRIERLFGLFQEQRIQSWFIDWRWFMRFWDIYYGTFHFVVTAGAMIWLYRRWPGRFALWRNVLAFTTGFALVGFATFPLMPPRLLPPSYGFVDTLQTIGGLWSFDSGTMSKVSNQYAAMPSLHSGWALWCVLALYPVVRSRWARGLLVAYPVATVFCIIVTANHYWLDAVGGVVTFTGGYFAAVRFTRWLDGRHGRAALTEA